MTGGVAACSGCALSTSTGAVVTDDSVLVVVVAVAAEAGAPPAISIVETGDTDVNRTVQFPAEGYVMVPL